jgi:hypothetical protein
MSARGLWIVALGAALVFLIALNVFRSEAPGRADANVISRRSGAAEDEPPAAQRPVEVTIGPRADRAGVQSGDAPSQSQPGPVPIPPSGPYASISAALADHDVPPERRITPSAELLEVERTFAAESVDPAWSAAAEAGVLRRIAQIPGAAYVSLNVECRTTLCLLQFVGSATPVPNSGIVEVTNLVKPEGLTSVFMMGIRVRGGAPVGIAYLQRDDSAAASSIGGSEAR